MHIILGILGVVVTILVLLNRLQDGGIDIGWLNPFSWHRRRKFRQQYQLSAAYTLDNPMDVAALFMLAIAKADGDITREQKESLLGLFESEFRLSPAEAKYLLGSSAHVLGNGAAVKSNPKAVVARCADKFTEEQVLSTRKLFNEVAHLDGAPSDEQASLLKSFVAVLPSTSNSQW